MTTGEHVEKRLKLANGGSIALVRTEGHLPVLLLAEPGAKGFSAVDLAEDEIDMIRRLLSEKTS